MIVPHLIYICLTRFRTSALLRVDTHLLLPDPRLGNSVVRRLQRHSRFESIHNLCQCWRFLRSIEYGFRKRTESPL